MDTDKPILVAGRTGQLARALIDLAAECNVPLVAVGRPQLDLADPVSIERVATSIAPRAIINAAAYTAVDRAEAEPTLAFAVNCDGAAQLAAAAAQSHIPFVHLSTDYVFDGHKVSPYREDDPPAPLSVYGRSKLAGEEAVRETYPSSLVLRTSWVYSSHSHNFVRTMLHLAATREVVRVINDQHGAPTAAADLARAILGILTSPTASEAAGLYHVTAAGETTWHGFAAAIFAGWARRGYRVPALTAITTAEYPLPARRPMNSRFDCSKIERTFGVRLPHWEASLEVCLDQIAASAMETQPC